jgi:hypothetical protein
MMINCFLDSAVIELLFSAVTMGFIGMQLWVFNKQRKDNLFKLICELRQDIIEQLKKEFEEVREDIEKNKQF